MFSRKGAKTQREKVKGEMTGFSEKTGVSSGIGLVFLAFASIISAPMYYGPYLMHPTDSSIVVLWRTRVQTPGTLAYGTDSTSLSQILVDSIPRVQHTLHVTGLKPDTKYYYKATSLPYESQVHHFHTHGPSKQSEFTFMVISDIQEYRFEWKMGRQLNKIIDSLNPDFVLTAGDNVHWCNESALYGFTRFFNDLGPALSHVPIYPAAGNHEFWIADYQIDDKAFDFYKELFCQIPTIPPNDSRFYEFAYGGCRFVTLNSGKVKLERIPGQMAWVKKTFGPTPHQAKFLFTTYHHPQVKDQIDTLLSRCSTDIAFEGHTGYSEKMFGGVRYLNNGFGDDFFIITVKGDSLHYEARRLWSRSDSIPRHVLLKRWSIVSRNAAVGISDMRKEEYPLRSVLRAHGGLGLPLSFQIRCNDNSPAHFSICSVHGKRLWRQVISGEAEKIQKVIWPGARSVANGVYLAILEGRSRREVRRFVVSR